MSVLRISASIRKSLREWITYGQGWPRVKKKMFICRDTQVLFVTVWTPLKSDDVSAQTKIHLDIQSHSVSENVNFFLVDHLRFSWNCFPWYLLDHMQNWKYQVFPQFWRLKCLFEIFSPFRKAISGQSLQIFGEQKCYWHIWILIGMDLVIMYLRLCYSDRYSIPNIFL